MGTRIRIIYAAIAFACATSAVCAKAGNLTYIGRGVWKGDSCYWHYYQNCCGQWCRQNLGPIANYPTPGTPGFYEKFAKWEFDAEENQREADLIKARFPNAVVQPQNVLTTGYNVLSQGYQTNLVQSGTTLQSTGLAVSPVDVNGIIHEAQRLQELAGVNSSQANAQVNTIVNSAVEGNSAAARIMAAGQVATATIMAATPPTSNTTVFQSRSISGPSNAATVSFASQQPSGDAVALLSHGLLVQQCAACHNPTKHAGNLDVTGDLSTLAAAREEIERRIRLPALDKDHMPRGKAELPQSVVNGILAGIPAGQTFAAHAETPPIPAPPDQPPLPPQQ